jgi:hypothetical protein
MQVFAEGMQEKIGIFAEAMQLFAYYANVNKKLFLLFFL